MTRFITKETQVIVHVTLPLFLSESANFPKLGSEGRARVGVLAGAVGMGEFLEVPELGGFLLPGFGLVKAGLLPLSLGLSRVLLAVVSRTISLRCSQYRASMG